MDKLNREIEGLLREHGADLVGFADLRGVPGADLPFGISVAVAVPPETIRSIHDSPSAAYFEAYHRINAAVDRLVGIGAEYLTEKGYRARAQTATTALESDDPRTPLPHKTVATRAGLGWIGKCALLVTERFGSGVRISSLLTDAELECGVPVDASRCGNCSACVNRCPASAVSGETWDVRTPRERIFDPEKCRRTARAISADRIGRQVTLCGKCIEVCPHTRKYLSRELGSRA